jgi:uncharacterized protein (TIGR04255 family)
MRQAPVYFTIVQVRFSPILALDSYAPQIQEKLRKHDFPDARKGVLATINLNPTAPTEASAPQVPLTQTMRYMFLNMQQTEAFILDQGALSFQTTEYDVFETFSEKFLSGLVAVDEAVGLSYTDRIGLRYLDAVFPKSGEKLRDYVCSSMLGLTEKLGGGLVHAFSESQVKMDGVGIVARAIIQEGPVGFPPDLQPMTLKVGGRFQELRGLHAVLDIDGSAESREAFKLEVIRERLLSIHGEIDKAFRASVTENALKTWE